MSQFQALLEILLFSLIIFMSVATVHIIFRGHMESRESLMTMPNNLRERGDYLLALIKEGYLRAHSTNN
jgi:hypothetical protein